MKKHFKYIFWAMLIAGALAYFFAATLPDGRLHVYALDVGQGDALLIRTPADEFILVDGGPNDAVLNELADIMPFYRRDIALVILTHPHADHVDGLVEVVRRYDVERVLMTGIDYNYAGYLAFLDAVAERGSEVLFANGEDLFFGGSGGTGGVGKSGGAGKPGGVTLDFLYPSRSLQGRTFTNINNSSIVFRLIYGETVFFFGGDCESECEMKILERANDGGVDLSADVLKVGHHGSRTSSDEALLDAVFTGRAGEGGVREGAGGANGTGGARGDGLAYAVIQVGAENRFKHPHPETVTKLQERGARILRTDIDGRVEFVSDGESILIAGITPS